MGIRVSDQCIHGSSERLTSVYMGYSLNSLKGVISGEI